jgi:hypothetical protein
VVVGRAATVSATIDPSRTGSDRRSWEDAPGFGAGAVGRPGRHSQGEAGLTTRAPSCARTPDAPGTFDSGSRSGAAAAEQQHPVDRGPAQQPAGDFAPAFGEQADASPATDIIPAIAARATQGRRR